MSPMTKLKILFTAHNVNEINPKTIVAEISNKIDCVSLKTM